MGSVMFYGGIIGVAVGVLLMIICLKVFPKQRRKLLEELGQEQE